MQFDESFFVALVTLSFFVLTFRPMKRAILGIIDSRIEAIRQNLKEAENLKRAALKLLQESEAKLAQAEEDAAEMVSRARADAESILSIAQAKLHNDIENRKKLALQKIQSFEERAIEDLKQNISAITVEVAAKAIDTAGNDNDFKKLVTTSIERLSKTIH